MFWIVITFLAVIALGAAIVLWMANEKPTGFFVALGTVIGWVAITAVFSLNTVGQRQVGIVKSFSGAITGSKTTGVVWIAPWSSMSTENIGLKQESFNLDQSNSAVSSDQQPIYADITLNYEVEPADVVKLYKTVGPAWKDTLLSSRVLTDFKEVTANFTAKQITTSRQQLRVQTKLRLAQELSPYGIKVVDFFVTNLDYTQEYKDAINAKNVQVQKALQAEAKVAQATAEANQTIAQAKGEAEAIRLKGAALRDNPQVLTLDSINALNPKASVIICTGTGAGNCPSFIPQTLTGTTTPGK